MSKAEGFTMIENGGALTGGRLKTLTASELSVWLMLRRFYNADKGYAYPSVPRIARETGYIPRTVERALQSLERKGWARTIRPGGGRRASHRIPTVPEALPPTDATGVDDAPTGAPGIDRQADRDPPTETTGQTPTQATGVQHYSQNQKQHHPHNMSGTAAEGEAERDFFSELGKPEPITWDRVERGLRDHRQLTQWKHAIQLAKGHGWEPIDIADLIEDKDLVGNPGLLYRRIDAGTRSKPGPTRKALNARAWFAEHAEQTYRDRANRLDADLDGMAGQLARSLSLDEARRAAAHILATSETGEPPTLAHLLSQAGAWLREAPAMREYRAKDARDKRIRGAAERIGDDGGAVLHKAGLRRSWWIELIEQAEAHLIDLILEWPERTRPQSPPETRQSAEAGIGSTEAQNAAEGQHGDAGRLNTIKAGLQADADRRIERARHLLDLAAATLIEDGLDEREARKTVATLYGLGLRPIDGEAEDATRERVRNFKRDELDFDRWPQDRIARHRNETRQRVWDQAREDHLADFPPTRGELLSGGSWATIDALADFATKQETRVLDSGQEWFSEWAVTQPKPEPKGSTEGSPNGSDPTKGQGAPDDAETAPAVDPKIAVAAAKLDAIREEKRKAYRR